MVNKIHDRSFILAPVIIEIKPEIQVENIKNILEEKERKETNKRKHQSIEKMP